MPPAESSPDNASKPVLRTLCQRTIVFDNEGFFKDFADWTEEICAVLSEESHLQLEARHWRVIWFLRDFYAGHGRAPLNNQLKKGTGMSLLEIESLFPGGIKNGARRLAGLPNPSTCT